MTASRPLLFTGDRYCLRLPVVFGCLAAVALCACSERHDVLEVAAESAAPAQDVSTLPERPFPIPTGPHAVGLREIHWVDEERPDVLTSAPDDSRRVPVRIWYPAEEPSGEAAPYILDLEEFEGVSSFEDAAHVRSNSYLEATRQRASSRYSSITTAAAGRGWSAPRSAKSSRVTATRSSRLATTASTNPRRGPMAPRPSPMLHRFLRRPEISTPTPSPVGTSSRRTILSIGLPTRDSRSTPSSGSMPAMATRSQAGWISTESECTAGLSEELRPSRCSRPTSA